MTPTSLYLTKDAYLIKSDLVKVIETKIETTSHCHPKVSCTVFDFMLHARTIAVAVERSNRNFGDLTEKIINRINDLFQSARRVDIVFDIYKEDSAKAAERLRRIKKDPINITITSI